MRQNIQLCFPGLGESEQGNLIRATLRHSLYTTFELAAIWCWPVGKVLNRVNQENICETFRQSNKGRIVIVPHLGNWEVVNLWLAREGNYMALYKPQTNQSYDEFILNARSRNGAQMLAIDASGLRQLNRGLKQRKTAMILPDQRPRKRRAQSMSSFFGHEAPTSPLIYNLCNKMDCDVFIATAFRDRKSARFVIDIEALDRSKLASDQQSSLDYMNNTIENLIKKKPEQYQWGYSRFRRSVYRGLDNH